MRQEIRAMAERRDLEGLQALAGRNRRVLSALIPLTYQPDGLLRWRAVEALGLAAARVAEDDPEFVRGILRRLHWSLSDESGSIGWSAPEAMGEIVARRSDLFADYAPIVATLFDNLEEEYFHPGILWAVGRIARRSPALVREALEPALALLADPRSQVRGLAAWCLGQMARPEPIQPLRALSGDRHPVIIYREGFLLDTTVGSLAQEAVAALGSA